MKSKNNWKKAIEINDNNNEIERVNSDMINTINKQRAKEILNILVYPTIFFKTICNLTTNKNKINSFILGVTDCCFYTVIRDVLYGTNANNYKRVSDDYKKIKHLEEEKIFLQSQIEDDSDCNYEVIKGKTKVRKKQ